MDLEIALRGPAGEPVDLWRTLNSHGLTELPPMALDEGTRSLEVTLPVAGGRPRTVRFSSGTPARVARVEVLGGAPGPRSEGRIADAARRFLRLDEDLSSFYELCAGDPDLAWATAGAGRVVRAPTVFEEVVKTICTTNCSWALTRTMVTAMVEHLGEPAPGSPADGWRGRAFPTPSAMASVPESFYRDVVRAGYRARHFVRLSGDVASGAVDLPSLEDPARPEEEVEAALIALPGIGPYAAAHVMLLLGRYSRLILDSWTRPTYARLRSSRRPVTDGGIARRFRRYGSWAGLAFWLYLTREWVADPTDP